jgi:hypothetical protein
MLPELRINLRDYIHTPATHAVFTAATNKRSVITKASAVPAFDFSPKNLKKPIKNT